MELHACPCGYIGDAARPCTCSSSSVTRYQKRVSGPLLDRIGIHLQVPRVEYANCASCATRDTQAMHYHPLASFWRSARSGRSSQPFLR
ncbi:ATP-binding protein [Candidatus Dojkabacteria bacterium]|nr:ATP-binding protein [Candidatus Dojkabacteria bacterium]